MGKNQAFESGVIVDWSSGHPLDLLVSAHAYVISKGHVDVFCATRDLGSFGARVFLYTLKEGQIFVGANCPKPSPKMCALVAAPGIDTVVHTLDPEHIQTILNTAELKAEFITKIGESLALLQRVSASSPLIESAVASIEEAQNAVLRGVEAISQPYWQFESTRVSVLQEEEDRAKRDSAKVLRSLLHLFRRKQPLLINATGQHALYAAFALVAESLGFELAPRNVVEVEDVHARIEALAERSELRVRQVKLHEGWWREDCGPLLGFYGDDDTPVALLPNGPSAYDMYNVAEGRVSPLSSKLAVEIKGYAYAVAHTFSFADGSASALLKWVWPLIRDELPILCVASFLAALCQMVLPLVVGIVFQSFVPVEPLIDLSYVPNILAIALVSLMTLLILIGNLKARILFKTTHYIQVAVMDRLLRLPLRFFNRFSTGELNMRVTGAESASALACELFVDALSIAWFILGMLVVSFVYSRALGAWVCIFLTFQIFVSYLLTRVYVRRFRAVSSVFGRMGHLATETVEGISKIQTAGAQHRFSFRWLELLHSDLQGLIFIRGLSSYAQVTFMCYAILYTAAIFVAIDVYGTNAISVGQFAGFSLAFILMYIHSNTIVEFFHRFSRIGPTYGLFKPILEAPLEITAEKSAAGHLQGDIEIVGLNYRYPESAEAVLVDVNMHIHPGEMVAIVGPSGAGKSTLMQLMLGFDVATSGGIYYDGRDSTSLNQVVLRRQLGVVLQNGRLFPGSILENIIGVSLLTEEDAWRAAALCGLDQDIKKMPMGMQTLISGSGGGLSGGQRQRILIARSLVRQPRILFLDEATSSLDNMTQEIVARNIAQLNSTRVVIAQRLSTIKSADRIYVLQKGHLVQVGKFDALLAQPGLFADLVKRQMT